MLKEIKWYIRNFIRKIKRLIRYLPVIWKSYDFDYSYATELFQMKLEDIATFMESDKAMTVRAKQNAKRIRMIVRLMNKVYNEEYGMEYMDTIEKLYGKTHIDFVETDETDKNGKPYCRLESKNELAVDEKHQKEIDEVRHQMMLLSSDKQKRAHRLLWKLIEHNIQHWWD
jgi:aspartyl-tRNA synthetase